MIDVANCYRQKKDEMTSEEYHAWLNRTSSEEEEMIGEIQQNLQQALECQDLLERNPNVIGYSLFEENNFEQEVYVRENKDLDSIPRFLFGLPVVIYQILPREAGYRDNAEERILLRAPAPGEEEKQLVKSTSFKLWTMAFCAVIFCAIVLYASG